MELRAGISNSGELIGPGVKKHNIHYLWFKNEINWLEILICVYWIPQRIYIFKKLDVSEFFYGIVNVKVLSFISLILSTYSFLLVWNDYMC